MFSQYINGRTKIELSIPITGGPRHEIQPGNLYTVLGITVIVGSDYQNGAIFEIKDDTNSIDSIPACLFEIVDSRSSSFWHGKIDGSAFLLWPKEFYTDYFRDNLTDGDPEFVKLFDRVVDRMENEFD